MRVDASGNVGVGVTSITASTALQVNTAGKNLGIAVGSSTTPIAGFNYYSGNSPDRFGIVSGIDGLLFQTGSVDIGSGTERARITSGGLMLLGVTSTFGGYNGFLVAKATAANVGIVLGVDTNGYNAMLFSNASNTSVGTIVVNSGGTAYNTTSDYRLKENVAPMTGALATVSALKPCTYTWKADGAAGQGFIAHELQAVVPDCVTGEKDATETYTDDNGIEQTRPKYQGVDTSYLVATLTAAIQELKAELDTTKARLAALEAN
jgi:hypothetical protein